MVVVVVVVVIVIVIVVCSITPVYHERNDVSACLLLNRMRGLCSQPYDLPKNMAHPPLYFFIPFIIYISICNGKQIMARNFVRFNFTMVIDGKRSQVAGFESGGGQSLQLAISYRRLPTMAHCLSR